ncbi:MAG: TRAP transporter substrate-binding protein, partial [Planctomycetes bacterium]|nr:TRAP transporter substrate-binding protein [Planctomycetota bacterium]
MKRAIFIMAMAVFVIYGLIGRGDAGQKTYDLKLGHNGAPTHHYHTICLEFAKRVKERTNGGVNITVYPSEQLGRMLELAEGVMLGTIDMGQTADNVMSNWVPDFGISLLPFLFEDLDETRIYYDGPVGQKIAKKLEPEGAVVVTYLTNGIRHVTNNR